MFELKDCMSVKVMSVNGTCNEEEVGEVHARTRRRTQTERADRESAAAATLPLYLAFCETLFMSRAYS